MNVPDIITTLSGIYAITYILDSLIEVNTDLNILKKNKERHTTAYNIIDDITIKNEVENQKYFPKEISYPKELKEIVIEFKNYIEPENFTICSQRLKDLKINYITILKDIKKYLQNFCENEGSYTPQNNTIDIYKIFSKKNVLSHEFLHMASSKDENCGFHLITRFEDAEIGRGLNEGYTELLNKRIWKYKNNSYRQNVKIVRLIETLFDDPKEMENAFFNNDLDKVFLQFLKYGTKEEFFEIMTNLDNLATTNQIIFSNVDNIKTQLKLYEIIKRSNDPKKITNFENILDENKFIKKLRHGKIILDKPNLKSKTK